MNPTLLAALVAVGAAASLATAAPALLAADQDPTCQDLAGQGNACVDVREDGVDVSVVVAPTIPPIAASSAATCVDLAGNGAVCQEGDQSAGTVTVTVQNDTLGLDSSTTVAYSIG